ncbi:MAG: hypothetical protein AAGA75_00940 [Cyanobacteria bacterium P01_E01_bin.6]
MGQRLKRWESPRNEGRNDKGRGGSARQRQKAKQLKGLRDRLKQNGESSLGSEPNTNHDPQREKNHASPVLFLGLRF